jgi:two-component sensor histidine kinase
VLRDVTVREQEREQLERTLRERTTLVKEIQHRVKNNLQMIVSLINLQADRISDAGTLIALQETQNRVRAIAAVHESLYATEDFGTISLGPYLHHWLRDLRSLYDSGNRIRLDLVSDDLALDIRDAIPLALISNELLSNSLRHAFPGDRQGVVTIRLGYVAASDRSTAPQEAELSVSDDGIGLPEGPGFFERTNSTGFELLRLLVAQLHARMDVQSSSAGTNFRISFPLEK